MTFKYITFSCDGTAALGEKIGKVLRGGDIIAFRGGLGVGKTTMTRGIAAGMGLSDCVSSPTFTLVNEYRGSTKLCHFDMYRISGDADLESIGFYDYLSQDCVTVIEWSENIADGLPKGVITVEIKRISDEEREITVIGDERFDFN